MIRKRKDRRSDKIKQWLNRSENDNCTSGPKETGEGDGVLETKMRKIKVRERHTLNSSIIQQIEGAHARAWRILE